MDKARRAELRNAGNAAIERLKERYPVGAPLLGKPEFDGGYLIGRVRDYKLSMHYKPIILTTGGDLFASEVVRKLSDAQYNAVATANENDGFLYQGGLEALYSLCDAEK